MRTGATIKPEFENIAAVNPSLPMDIILTILTKLSTMKAWTMSRCLLRDPNITGKDRLLSFWDEKFKIHFPHRYITISNQPQTNIHKSFLIECQTEYADLKPDFVKIVDNVKDNRETPLPWKSFEAMKMDLNRCVHRSGFCLLYWANKNKNQSFLNKVYKMASDYYQCVPDDIKAQTMFTWATRTNQDIDTLTNLMPKNPHTPNEYYYRDHSPKLKCHEDTSFQYKTTVMQALDYAALDGNTAVVKFVLNQRQRFNLPTNLSELLFYAVRGGHLDTVNELISLGASIDIATSYEETPLYIACDNDDTVIIDCLIRNGASLTKALHAAIRNKNKPVIRILKDRGMDIDINAFLIEMVEKKHIHMIKPTLECGATISSVELDDLAALPDGTLDWKFYAMHQYLNEVLEELRLAVTDKTLSDNLYKELRTLLNKHYYISLQHLYKIVSLAKELLQFQNMSNTLKSETNPIKIQSLSQELLLKAKKIQKNNVAYPSELRNIIAIVLAIAVIAAVIAISVAMTFGLSTTALIPLMVFAAPTCIVFSGWNFFIIKKKREANKHTKQLVEEGKTMAQTKLKRQS